MPLVSGLRDGFYDGGIVQFLRGIDFIPPGAATGVVMFEVAVMQSCSSGMAS